MLYVVGFGCGARECITAEAEQAMLQSDVIVGYKTYTALMKPFFPDKQFVENGMRQESARVRLALEYAQKQTVSLICSGDPELYGMAALTYEYLAGYPGTEIQIVPGITAAFSGGAVLGAPLTHDTAIISLSDLLTPMEKIERRLRCAAEGDFVIVLYNPSSKQRADYLKKACDIILQFRSPETVCGYVKNIGREGETSRICLLSELRNEQVDMFTTVYIGNSETRIIGGKMVTPRGYSHG
ncbi:MAG: precorrin-3B C(17)-methyltransferase [Oscillospiraceae bacterium]|nr:precorrin-3B C(17)-methyltransferase [Oscillospiraceae bacterium]MBR4199885.1 precorrin-3B C(17)-methyltransferase [Oscillospiraceae bacterium]